MAKSSGPLLSRVLLLMVKPQSPLSSNCLFLQIAYVQLSELHASWAHSQYALLLLNLKARLLHVKSLHLGSHFLTPAKFYASVICEFSNRMKWILYHI